jgi:hypothetical protein
MPLFQESIVKKHLGLIEKDHIDAAYEVFKRVYSAEKIKNIRTAKEEQYQEGFIKDVFGAVLGYSVFPESPFNIQTEKKNESDAKKADGAILRDDKVVGVIELKDNTTKNLDSVKDQAFGYKHSHKECSYVISSNFHKLRFYIDDATDYEEFDLYNLDKETFKRFYLYLRKEGLLDKNLPKLLREETKFHEEEISKKLYKDYSSFKRRFFENAVKNNPQQDKLLLFRKSQKFLDRILFLLFAEDKGLVGTNSVVKVVEKWSEADEDYYRPLYEMVNTYFSHLYRGFTYQKTGEVIPQFGGELFAPDEVLESLTIDDTVLKNDLLILSKYDFNTDVDVNILGHIFEHSLNEVDDVEAELRGETLDKSKSKRKKDGVFYTPKYITKYIVDNTLGKLCAEKRTELGLDRDLAIFDYQKADGKLNEKGKDLYERLNAYQAWLLTLKVCDPACGSGAFLNQALSFFIDEHRFVDDLIAELLNTPLRLYDIDLQILENNIYGVDINDESIEIAKLSLWLRTAQPGRKLSDLSRNIRCGNSLIDDPAVAGDKAFNWQHAFPDVFAKGGFDVVIGNPPYLRVQGIKENHNEISSHIEANYKSAKGRYDLYILFIEKSVKIINKNGKISFILPHNFIAGKLGIGIRELLSSNKLVEEIVHFGSHLVFKDASTYTCILSLSIDNLSVRYSQISPENLLNPIKFDAIKYDALAKETWQLTANLNSQVLEKMRKSEFFLSDFFAQVARGVVSGADDIFILKGTLKEKRFIGFSKELNSKIEIESGLIHRILMGNSISRYGELNNEKYILYPHKKIGGETKIISEEEMKNDYPLTYQYLLNFKDALVQKKIKYKTNPQYWYGLHNSRSIDIFKSKKIITPYLANNCQMAIDESDGFLTNDKCSSLILKPEFSEYYDQFLAILNSRLVWFFIKETSSEFSGGYFAFTNLFLNPLPCPKSIVNFHVSKPLVKSVIQLKTEVNKLQQRFLQFTLKRIPTNSALTKLENWHTLTFPDFIKELNKAIKASKGVALTKKDEFEWMELFEENKKKVLELKTQIDQTDREIDRMVYALYGLTEEEIRIVEQG